MKFTPLSETEISEVSLLRDGIYNYRVVKSEEKISRSGNEYISLVLSINDHQGIDHFVFTNLSLIKLLKHFCDVNNMQDDYQRGEIHADSLVGKSGGQVIIGIEGEKPNPSGGVYKSKNIVKDYIQSLRTSVLTPLSQKDDFINDEIPF